MYFIDWNNLGHTNGNTIIDDNDIQSLYTPPLQKIITTIGIAKQCNNPTPSIVACLLFYS